MSTPKIGVRNNRRERRDRHSSSPEPEAMQPAVDKPSGTTKTKEKTFMDRWVEPSLAAPKASYQDHGGAPYGVLEHMQPLGEAPSTKAKTRVRPESSRKSVLGRSSAAAAAAAAAGSDAAQESPEGSPAPPAPSSASAYNASRHTASAFEDDDDDGDGDYAPKKSGKRKERSTRRAAAKRDPSDTAAAAAAAAAAATPTVETRHKTKGKSRSKASQLDPYEAWYPALPRPTFDDQKLARVADAAILRAHQIGKPDLAAAVHKVHEHSNSNLPLRLLLERILQHSATADERKEFQDHVRAAKREIKDARAKGSSAATTPASASTSRQLPPTSVIDTHPHHALPSPSKLTLLPGPQVGVNSSNGTLPSTEHPEPTKPKISLKFRASAKDAPNHRASLTATGMSSVVSKSPRKRADSVGSDSSLTSLTSNEEPGDMDLDNDEPMPTEDSDHLRSPPKFSTAPHGKSTLGQRGGMLSAAGGTGLKRSSADAGLDGGEYDDERERALAAKKQKLSERITRDDSDYYEESNIRPAMNERITRTAPKKRALPLLKLPGLGAARNSSSRAASLEVDSPLSSASTPRASPPPAWKGPPRPPGKRAKTKQSPEKKHQAANGGMTGVGAAGGDSPIGDDDNEELSENNDFCSACGGSGYLLCCDGCDRSFHFSCLDPPLSDDAKELNEPWFCYVCVAKRPVMAESPEKPLRGLFAPLLTGLKKRNPANFMLPPYIREYFEGVSADRNGNFIESVNKPTRNRPGYSSDRPDFRKLRDAKGVIIQCYACGLSSQGRREIIPCDFCSQHWHLDCLDPPLANAPGLNPDGFKVQDWMCPLHVDKELRRIDAASLSRRRVHIRRPKAAKVFETSLTRGFRNSGIIDVLDDSSDDSDSEFYDHDDGGTVYKLPASGIKLDFIDKVKTTRVQQIRDEQAHRRVRLATSTPSVLSQANFAKRPFVEKQLALNLSQFALDNQDLDLGSDQIESLVGALIAEAPIEVVREVTSREEAEKAKSASSAIPPSPPASEQPEQLSAEMRKELRMLQELIRRKLESSPT